MGGEINMITHDLHGSAFYPIHIHNNMPRHRFWQNINKDVYSYNFVIYACANLDCHTVELIFNLKFKISRKQPLPEIRSLLGLKVWKEPLSYCKGDGKTCPDIERDDHDT